MWFLVSYLPTFSDDVTLFTVFFLKASLSVIKHFFHDGGGCGEGGGEGGGQNEGDYGANDIGEDGEKYVTSILYIAN